MFYRIISVNLMVLFFLQQLTIARADVTYNAPLTVYMKQIEELRQEVLNQERLNRDAELNIRNMSNDPNLTKDQSVNATLDQYTKTLDARDRNSIGALETKAAPIEPPVYSTDPVYVDALIKNLEGKKETLQDKSKNLTLLRNELAEINERLRVGNSHQDKLLVQYADTIDQLKSRLSQLEQARAQQLDQLNSNNSANTTIADLMKQNTAQKREIDELSSALNRKTSEMAEITIKHQYDNDIIHTHGPNKASIAEVSSTNHNGHVTYLTGQSIIVEKPIVEKTVTKSTVDTKRITDLIQRLQTADERISNYDNIIAEKDAEIAMLNSQLAETKKSLTDMLKEINKKDIYGQKLSDTVQDLKEEIAALKQAPVVKEDNNDEALEMLTKQVNSSETFLKEKDKRITDLQQQLSDAQEDLNLGTNTVEGYRKLFEKIRMELDDIVASMEQRSDDLMQLEEQVSTLRKKMETMQAAHNKEVARLKEQVTKAQKEQALHAGDDRIVLAKKLINVQQKQIDLLGIKDVLRKDYTGNLEGYVEKPIAMVKTLNAKQQRELASLTAKQKQELASLSSKQQQEVADLREELNSTAEQLALVKEELKTKISESVRMETMLNVYQDKLKKNSQSFDTQSTDLMASRKHQSDLEKTIRDLTDQLALKDAEIKKVKDYFYELEKKHAQKEEELQAKEINIAMMQKLNEEEAAKNNSQSKRLKTTVDEQKELVEQQRTQIENLKKDLALAQSQITMSPRPEDIAALDAKLKSVIQERDTISLQLDARTTEFVALKAKSEKPAPAVVVKSNEVPKKEAPKVVEKPKVNLVQEKLQGQIATLKEQLKGKDEDISFKEKEIQRMKLLSNNKIKEYNLEVDNLTKKIDQMTAQLNKAGKNDEVSSLKAKIAKNQVAIDSLNKQLDITKKRQISNNEETIKNLKEQLAQAKKGTTDVDLKNRIKELEEINKELVSKQDRGRLRAALQESRGQVDAIREELNQAKDHYKDLEVNLATKEKELNASRSRLESKNDAINELKEKIQSTDQMKAAKKQDVEIVSSSINESTSTKESTKEVSSKDNAEQMNALLHALDKEKNYSQKLERELINVKKELASTQKTIEDKDGIIAQLNKKFAKIPEQQKSAKELQKQVSSYKKQVEDLAAQLNAQRAKPAVNTALQAAQNEQIKQLDYQLRDKSKTLDVLERELKAKTENYVSQQKEIDLLREQLSKSKASVNELTMRVDNYQRTLEEMGLGNEGYLVRDGKSTSMAIRQINNRIKGWQSEIETVMDQRDVLKTSYDQMSAQLQETKSLLQSCLGKISEMPPKKRNLALSTIFKTQKK